VSAQRFTTIVEQSGTKVYITLPFDPNAVWGVKERHHISGSINGCPFRGPIEAIGTEYFIALGPAWRRDNGIDVGAEVEVVLAPEGPQTDNIARDIARALEAEPEARTFFESLPSFYRKNYIRWIESAKRPETRAARIAEAVKLLKAGVRQK
jgi:hypothetical protein